MQRTILHVDMDAFYAAIEQQDRPELRGKPVIVGAPRDKRGVVAAVSYEARPFGIHSAMPSREAARRCPQAVFLPPNMARYEEVSRQISSILERFTPLIEPLSLDEAFLDVTDARRLFGDGPAIARRIRAAIKAETGLTASVGVAPNKFLAKLASELNKPDGLTVIPDDPAGIQAFLAPLPVGRMWGVGDVTRPRLEKAGCRTIGDLQCLPLETLVRLVGEDGARLFKALAMGLDDRPVETEREEKSISREHTFDEDVQDRSKVEAVLVELAEDVGRRLREAGRKASGAQIKLRWRGFDTLTRRKKLASPADDDFTLLAVARELFAREKLIKPVRLIGFGVHGLTGEDDRQLMLFDDAQSPGKKREKISHTVDAIRRKFGSDSIRLGGGKGSPHSQ
ncbi:MAG: DNA polymerase IV [Lentisphaerae bacterium]|nr:DNA polymerase IV [Lentisphaerota bacterium]